MYMCRSMVSTVMLSGLGSAGEPYDPDLVSNRGSGESGGRVVEDESLSSYSPSSNGSSGIVGSGSRPSNWLDNIFCLMRDGEKGVFLGGVGDRNSCTVDRMAVVISALEV